MADRVTFTPGSADRIAKVVRRVEAGNRDATGYVPSPRLQGGSGGGKVFRVCTFTGAWAITGQKTISFVNAPAGTVVALNLFANISAASSSRSCAIAKEGTQWYLIAAQC